MARGKRQQKRDEQHTGQPEFHPPPEMADALLRACEAIRRDTEPAKAAPVPVPDDTPPPADRLMIDRPYPSPEEKEFIAGLARRAAPLSPPDDTLENGGIVVDEEVPPLPHIATFVHRELLELWDHHRLWIADAEFDGESARLGDEGWELVTAIEKVPFGRYGGAAEATYTPGWVTFWKRRRM